MDDLAVCSALASLPRELAQAVLAVAAAEAELPAGTLASQRAMATTETFASEKCWIPYCTPKCERCYGSDGPSVAAVDRTGSIVSS